MHPPEGGGLCDGPPVRAVDGSDREVLRRTPEVLRGVAAEPARVDGDVAVDRRVVRGQAEARDRGVEAELGVEPVVGARLEEELVAARAELGRLLLREHLVQSGLDARGRGVEDDDVRAEVTAAGQGQWLDGCGGCRRGQADQGGCGRRGGHRSENGPASRCGGAGVRGVCEGRGHGGNSPGSGSERWKVRGALSCRCMLHPREPGVKSCDRDPGCCCGVNSQLGNVVR